MATPTTLPASFTAGQVLTAAQMNDLRGAFRVLQVVSTTKTSAFTTTAAAGSPVLVTGLTATITPSSTSSKILVVASVSLGQNTAQNQAFAFLYRGGSAIILGDSNGSRTRVTAQSSVAGNGFQELCTMTYLDSPASVAALTYQVYVATNVLSGGTVTVNQSFTNSNTQAEAASTSTITVMEISA
jgi:hypothetical protein